MAKTKKKGVATKKVATPKQTKIKFPKAKRALNPTAKAIMKETKKILDAGGTKTVTKTVYKVKPSVAMKQAAAIVRKQKRK